jgi:hypothetical protein
MYSHNICLISDLILHCIIRQIFSKSYKNPIVESFVYFINVKDLLDGCVNEVLGRLSEISAKFVIKRKSDNGSNISN